MCKRLLPYSIIVLLCFVIIGCRLVSDSLNYYELCKGDVACAEAMQHDKDTASIAMSKVIDSRSDDNSFSWVIGSLFGSVVSFLTGVWRGKRMKGSV